MGELKFELDVKLIDDDLKLQEEYGEQVPVILIEDKVHDYWRVDLERFTNCLLYTSPSPRDGLLSRMPSSA